MNAILSEMQIRILEALGTYRILNRPLMKRLNVGKDDKTLGDNLRKLSGMKLIHKRDAGVIPGMGRQHALYMLAPAGAEFLRDLTGNEQVSAPRTMSAGQQHIRHWLGVISCHIALRSWANAERVQVDWFRSEFERKSGHFRATRMEWEGKSYTPDALAQISLPDGTSRILVWEFYRDSLQHAIDKLETRVLPAMDSEIVERNLETDRKAGFLIVFDTPSLRDKALARWPHSAASEWRRAFVKALDDLHEFKSGWWKPDGAVTDLFRDRP